MAKTPAQIRASVNYNRRQDSITIRPSKSNGAMIRKAASISGQSLQNYILDAVKARMESEGIHETESEE